MSNKVAHSIRRGLTQALAYAKREAREADYRVHVPAEINGLCSVTNAEGILEVKLNVYNANN